MHNTTILGGRLLRDLRSILSVFYALDDQEALNSSHLDTHDGSNSSVLRVQVGQLFQREARTDVGVDNKELLQVG